MKSVDKNKCLSTDGRSLNLIECNSNDEGQMWTWKETYLH
jgi:hypothetical protein